ncbi:MAG: hypothetical protein WEG36_14335 [Gemmatimonadota bacterium]
MDAGPKEHHRFGDAPGFVSLGLIFAVGVLLIGCESSTSAENSSPFPPGPDVSEPFPLDRGDDGAHTPGSYKGLPLRLVTRDEPSVTPVDGIIGVVCIGMSNATQECQAYKALLDTDWADEVNPAVRVVDCARGGHAIERWIDPDFDEVLWEACLEVRLPAAGVRPDQVRVLYHKAANQFTTGPGGVPLPTYPDAGSDFNAFHEHLSDFSERVPDWFPSVVAVYTASRSFGGFAGNPGRGEPLSYEEGHALNRWLAGNPQVEGVWYGWGPYLWAPSCVSGGSNASGLCYDEEDYIEDGVHPSGPGRAKIAGLIHGRFLRESWYRR